MGVIKDNSNSKVKSSNSEIDNGSENIQIIVKPDYEIVKLDDKNFIKLDDLSSKIEKLTDKIKVT
jgi:hypothetical protein